MPQYNSNQQAVDALQWTGGNLADIQAMLGYAAEVDETDDSLRLPGVAVPMNHYVVLAPYRVIYSVEPTLFAASFTEIPGEVPPP